MLQLKANPGFADTRWSCKTLREAFESALKESGWSATADACVLVGLFDLDDWLPWLAGAYAMLDAQEQQRVQRRRAVVDRDQLALSYALHRLLLGKVLDCDPAEVPIGRDAAGCPCLPGGTLCTSLSHADRRVLSLAITATGRVGVDIESSHRASVMPELAERVCHPHEMAELRLLAEPARSEALLALWVRKEAYLKAAGIGLQREMGTFAAPRDALLELPGGEMTRVRMLEAGPHWVAAVAGAPEVPIASRWLRICTTGTE